MSVDATAEAVDDALGDARAYVGPSEQFDLAAAMQFNLLTMLGLREHHHLLDIGCGTLRAGRLFVVYLQPDHYAGLEPQEWLVEQGVAELGADLVARRRPTFRHDDDFSLGGFGRRFDYVLAQSIFSHASVEQIRSCLAEVADVLAPGGRFCATFMPGPTDYSGSSWVYPECVTYRPQRMRSLAAEAGLTAHLIDWAHPSGQRWVVFTHPSSDLAVDREVVEAADPVLLNWKLETTRVKLDRLTSHPWVRVGRRVQRGLSRVSRVLRSRDVDAD